MTTECSARRTSRKMDSIAHRCPNTSHESRPASAQRSAPCGTTICFVAVGMPNPNISAVLALCASLPMLLGCQLLVPVDDVVTTARTASARATTASKSSSGDAADAVSRHSPDAGEVATDEGDEQEPEVAVGNGADPKEQAGATGAVGAAASTSAMRPGGVGGNGGGGTSDSTMAGTSGGSAADGVDTVPPGCRRFPTKTTYVTSGGENPSTGMQECSFDRTTLTRTCTSSSADGSETDSPSPPTTSKTTWSSITQALRHGVPMGYWSESFDTSEGGPCAGVTTQTYDSQGRRIRSSLVRSSMVDMCSGSVSTCTAWDAQGRMLRCSAPLTTVGAPPASVINTYVYNESDRTVTVRQMFLGAVGNGSYVSTFDVEGWSIKAVTTYEPTNTTTTTTYQIVERQTVCP